MTESRRLSPDRIREAVTFIDPVFLDSPQFLAESLGLDYRLVVKVETMNPIRSFKARGTEFLMASLEGPFPLVCATAGNFGQGMAWSARKRGLALTVFTAVNANPLKVERMRALGADVRLVGGDVEAAHVAGAPLAQTPIIRVGGAWSLDPTRDAGEERAVAERHHDGIERLRPAKELPPFRVAA